MFGGHLSSKRRLIRAAHAFEHASYGFTRFQRRIHLQRGHESLGRALGSGMSRFSSLQRGHESLGRGLGSGMSRFGSLQRGHESVENDACGCI